VRGMYLGNGMNNPQDQIHLFLLLTGTTIVALNSTMIIFGVLQKYRCPWVPLKCEPIRLTI